MERTTVRLDFTYPKGYLIVRLFLTLLLILLLAMIMLMFSISGVWSYITIAILIIYFIIVGVSPLFTDHWVTLTRLVLRQGWYFKVSIPYTEIESIGRTDELGKYGLRSALFKGKVYIVTSQQGLVSIKLRNPIRFLMILGKEANELIVSVEQSEAFVSAVRERMKLLPPIHANGTDAELGY